MDETEEPLTDDEIWSRLSGAEAGERVDLLLELTERAAADERHDRVIAIASGTVEAAQAIGRSEAEARAMFLTAEAQAAQQLTDEAVASYGRAAELYLPLVDEASLAECHYRAGWALSGAGRVEDALAEWVTTQRIASQVTDGYDGTGKAALARSKALEQLGRLPDALDALNEAREAFRQHGDAAHTCWADDRAAGVLLNLGRTEEAVTWLERCLAVARSVGDPQSLAYARVRLAGALRLDGRADAALTHAQTARRGFRRVGDHYGVAGSDREAGLCHEDLGDRDTALNRMQRSRAVYDAIGADSLVRTLDLDIAGVLWGSGDRVGAVAGAERALRSAKDAGDGATETTIAAWLADRLIDLGRAEEAADVLESAPPPTDAFVASERGMWLAVAAKVRAARGDNGTAEQLATEGLHLMEQTSFSRVKAALYAARSDARRGADPVTGDADRARAMAHALAAGDLEQAIAIARPLLERE